MNPALYILPLFLLAACAAPVVSEQRAEEDSRQRSCIVRFFQKSPP